MIRIVHPLLEEVIQIKRGEIVSLVIESNYEFYKMNFELNNAINNKEECSFVFSFNDKTLIPSKDIFIINNIPSFDINDKRIQSALLKAIINNERSLDIEQELQENNIKMYKTLKCLLKDFDFDIELNESPELKKILSAFEISIDCERTFKINDLLNWLNIIHELINPNLIIINSFNNFYSEKSLFLLQQEVSNTDWHILFLENTATKKFVCKQYIYDDDNCYIKASEI